MNLSSFFFPPFGHLCTGRSHFIVLHRHVIFFFLQIEDLWQLCIEEVY